MMGRGEGGELDGLIEVADRVAVDSRMTTCDAGMFRRADRGGRKAEAVG